MEVTIAPFHSHICDGVADQVAGYVLGLVLEACIQFQSTKAHVDPLHVTAHFVRTTLTTAFDVCIRVVKIGAGFTNLTADLVQDVNDFLLDLMLHTS